MRFPDFEGEWEETPIRNLLDFQNGINATADKYGSGIKYISVSDILNSSYITYDAIKGLVDIDDKTLNNFSVNYGDILFQRSSETQEDIGRSNVYLDYKTATFGGFVIRGKKIGEYNPVFFKHLLDTQSARKVITRLGAGAQHYNIGQDSLRTVQLYFPTIQEQDKISELLLVIDKKISLYKKYIELLKSYKRGALSKLFPQKGETTPKYRFAGFTEPWKQHKIKDLFKITRGYVLAASMTSDRQTESMLYPVYSSQTKSNGLMGYYKDYLYENAITWTTDGANAGTVNFRAGKFYCTNVCGVLLANTVAPDQMIAEALSSVAKNHVSYVGNPKLMNNVMAEIIISLPENKEERQAISSIFAFFDQLINYHQQKLDEIQTLKSGLLQQLFI